MHLAFDHYPTTSAPFNSVTITFPEAVSGIVGRADVMACFFYLSSWLAYQKGCPLRHDTHKDKETYWSWIVLSIVLVTLSMLTKEQGITVLGVCGLYDVVVVTQIRIQNFVMVVKQV